MCLMRASCFFLVCLFSGRKCWLDARRQKNLTKMQRLPHQVLPGLLAILVLRAQAIPSGFCLRVMAGMAIFLLCFFQPYLERCAFCPSSPTILDGLALWLRRNFFRDSKVFTPLDSQRRLIIACCNPKLGYKTLINALGKMNNIFHGQICHYYFQPKLLHRYALNPTIGGHRPCRLHH